MLQRIRSNLAKYQHKWIDGTVVDSRMSTASKILCVARNYTDLEEEKTKPITKRMENAAVFLKPPSSLVHMNSSISLNGYTDVVCETEMAILIGREIVRTNAGCTSAQAGDAVIGLSVGYDLTRKNLQNKLKAVGKPWELSKAFDGACPLAPFIPIKKVRRIFDRTLPSSIELILNGELVLSQSLNDMILSPTELVQLLTQHFTICPGDVIMTGTPTLPQQPPQLKVGDTVQAFLGKDLEISSTVM
jgi:2-keto-4-pentenoate hydratase/2-oxohepta-3-ene-1,7-dioic acid hydratase in catechol pathway